MDRPPAGLLARSTALRATRVGASEAAGLAGWHPYATPASIYARIVLGVDPGPPSPEMRAGIALERAILRVALGSLELAWSRWSRFTWTHPTLPLAATPDGIGARPDGATIVAEAKLAGDPRSWSEGPPPWYVAQARLQRVVTGRDRGYLVGLVGARIRTLEIEPDAEAEEELLEAVAAFDRDHLRPRLPPPADPERDRDLVLTLADLEAGSMVADGRLAELGDVLAVLAGDRLAAERAEAQARATFIAELAACGASEVLAPGRWTASVRELDGGRRSLTFRPRQARPTALEEVPR